MPATTASKAAPDSSAAGTSAPRPNPLQRAFTTWARLLDLGNSNLRRDIERHSRNWVALAKVRSLPGLIKHQQQFAKTIWTDQQNSLRTAARILREGFGTPEQPQAKAPSPVQPVAKAVPQAAPKPTPQAAPKPTPQAAPKPAPQAAPKPTPQAAPKPTPQAAPKPTPQAAPKPTPQAAPKPASKAAPKPATKAAPKTAEAPAAPVERAQAKPVKASVEPTARQVEEASAVIPRFELYCDKAGEYRFRLQAADGPVLLRSEGYKTRGSALNGINSVRKNAKNRKRYAEQRSASGKPTFNLKAGNHQVIGSSATFASTGHMETTIALLQRTAADAELVDRTDEQRD